MYLKDEYVWCDRNHKYLTLEEIDNKYLLNILNFILRGGGYVDEMSEESIKRLFNEANKRKLKHKFKLKQLLDMFYYKVEHEGMIDWAGLD